MPCKRKSENWIVEANANDLLLFRTEPHYYRSLPTGLAKKCFEMSENGATRSEIAKVMNAGTGMRLGMLEGILTMAMCRWAMAFHKSTKSKV